MEFLNPTAIYGFFFLPLLLIPYLIKGRPRRALFSSLLLLHELSSRPQGRPWGTLRLPPIFFLQLLLLLLLIGSLAEPVFSVRPLKIAIILDNSASMQALEGQKSRFEMAQDQARDLVRDLSANARIDLYHTVPRLQRFATEALTPNEALPLIATLKPLDLAESEGSYGEELFRLLKEKSYERIYFLTDHPARGQGEAIRVTTVGRPKENLAITSFHLRRPSFSSSQMEANVEVTSFSSREEKVKVSLKANGKLLAFRTLSLPPRKSAMASFDGFPVHLAYEAELEVSDGLALDNRAFAVLPASKELEILGISPRPQELYSLRTIPGLKLNVIPPEAYGKIAVGRHSLVIFHFSAPAVLPQNHAVFILPPKQNPLVAVGESLSRPQISSWSDPHPLTRYINFALFRPPYARPLKPLALGDAIIQSPEGALAIGLEHKGFRYLALGFDPFPYLGRENLPVSIFTLNLLDWFYEGMGTPSVATGEPLQLSDRQEGGVLVTPKGEQFPIQGRSTSFSGTYFQGFYHVGRDGEKEVMAVNFLSLRESDLSNPATLNLREEPGVSASHSFFFSLWPYLLLLSILLLLLEWFSNPPVTQS